MSATKKPKHTEGPWIVLDLGEIVAEDDLEVLVATIDLGTAEGEANARLIAAAPDLLDALKACARILPNYASLGKTALDDEACDAVIEQVNEAIAKAEGGQ